MALPAETVVLWKCDDGDGVVMDDATGDSANDLLIETVPTQGSTYDFTIGANHAGNQRLSGRIAHPALWHRKLTSGEKTARSGGEFHPYATTTTLQDYKAEWLLDETTGSTTFDEASGDSGNDLTEAGGDLTRVAGPNGSDYGQQFDGAGDKLFKSSPGDDLQHGHRDCTMACWCYFDVLPTSGAQALMMGQLAVDNPYGVGACIYWHAGSGRFHADYGRIDQTHFRNNAVVVSSLSGITTGVWYHVLFEYEKSTSTLKIEVTPSGGSTTVTSFTPAAYPETVSPLISTGSAARFGVPPLFDPATQTSGFDLVGGRFAYLTTWTSDMKLASGSPKAIAFWSNQTDSTGNQTVIGGIDDPNIIDNFAVQISLGRIYFLIGDGQVGSFDYCDIAYVADKLYICQYDPGNTLIAIYRYDNGLEESDTTASTKTPTANPTVPFRVGCAYDGAPQSFFAQQYRGSLDAIAIINKLLTSGERDDIDNGGLGTETLPGSFLPMVRSSGVGGGGVILA